MLWNDLDFILQVSDWTTICLFCSVYTLIKDYIYKCIDLCIVMVFVSIYLPIYIYLYYPSIIIRNLFNNISLSLGGTLVCSMHDIYIIYVFSHTWMLAHMMLSIGEMHRNGIQHYAPSDDPYFWSVYYLFYYWSVLFYACKYYICLPISAHGLWEWLMNLALCSWLT